MGLYFTGYVFYGFQMQDDEELKEVHRFLNRELGVWNASTYFDTGLRIFAIPGSCRFLPKDEASYQEKKQGFIAATEIERVLNLTCSELFQSVKDKNNAAILFELRKHYKNSSLVGAYYAQHTSCTLNMTTHLSDVLPIRGGQLTNIEVTSFKRDSNVSQAEFFSSEENLINTQYQLTLFRQNGYQRTVQKNETILQQPQLRGSLSLSQILS